MLNEGHQVTCVDIKPLELWFQKHDGSNNHSLDLKVLENCEKIVEGHDYVINMACNMGGMGFIENNKAECMQSVLINTNLLIACKDNNIQRYFFSSSACAYNTTKQQDVFVEGL